MQSSSLIEIFRTFNESDLKRFDDFISSPFFNRKPTVIKLWAEIKKHAPKFDSEELSRKNVYERIVSGKKYNYGTMKNMLFDLTKLTEQFLAHGFDNNTPFMNEFRTMKAFLERGLKRQFIKSVSRKFSSLMEGKYSFGDFEKLTLLCELCNEHWVNAYFYNKPYDTIKYSYFSFLETYTTCYNNIRVGNNDLAESLRSNREEEVIRNLEIVSIAENLLRDNDNHSRIVKFYLMLNDAFKSPDQIEYYHKAKEYLSGLHDLFEPTSLNYCYRILSNVILNNKMIPLNKRMDEFSSLVKFLINKGIMFPPGQPIGILEFSNIVKLTNDAGVLKKLLDDNLENVLEKYRKNMKEYAMAHFYYLTKDYASLMKTCARMKFDLFLFKADIKAIQLKALFEMNDFESFEYQADSFIRTLPKTKKLREEYITVFINLAETVKKLFRYRETKESRYYIEIVKILESQKVHSYVWVANRLAELSKDEI